MPDRTRTLSTSSSSATSNSRLRSAASPRDVVTDRSGTRGVPSREDPVSAINEAADGDGKYASVNGLNLYYEVHGTGDPLVIIPGGTMTIAMMGPLVSVLARSRQVIAIEPQAHGHTADVDRPLTYEQMADDTAALIAHLGLRSTDVLGFSVGGGVALQTAIR